MNHTYSTKHVFFSRRVVMLLVPCHWWFPESPAEHVQDACDFYVDVFASKPGMIK